MLKLIISKIFLLKYNYFDKYVYFSKVDDNEYIYRKV